MKHVVAKLVGCQGGNPQVSHLSRFHDEVWDFSNEIQNPSTDKSQKRIGWSFEVPRGGRFNEPVFGQLMLASKQFIYALRWHPIDGAPLAASAVVQLFSRTKRFLDHLLSYPHPILRFKDVLPHHCEDYIQSVLGGAFSVSHKYALLQVLQRLFQYREVMIDGLVMDPFQGRSVRKFVGYTHARQLETQTQVIPEEILGLLVRASLEYVDRFADYLLDTCDAIEDIRAGGRSFDYWSNRYLNEHVPTTYGLDGTKFQSGVCSVRQLNHELNYLQTACFVLIAFATGMRVSEILSLREGCCETQKEPGQSDLVWLRSRVFKMQGVPEGRKAKWLGGPVCARAVRVLERLGKRVRRRLKARFLWLPIPSFQRPREPNPLVALAISWRLRNFIAMLGLRDASGRPFHLHPHMFRRYAAFQTMPGEIITAPAMATLRVVYSA